MEDITNLDQDYITNLNKGDITYFPKGDCNSLKEFIQFLKYQWPSNRPHALNFSFIPYATLNIKKQSIMEYITFETNFHGLKRNKYQHFKKFVNDISLKNITTWQHLLAKLPDPAISITDISTEQMVIVSILQSIYQNREHFFIELSFKSLSHECIKSVAKALLTHQKLNKNILYVQDKKLLHFLPYNTNIIKDPMDQYKIIFTNNKTSKKSDLVKTG